MEGKWKDRCRGWKTEQIRKKKPGQGKKHPGRDSAPKAQVLFFFGHHPIFGAPNFDPYPCGGFQKMKIPKIIQCVGYMEKPMV
jgi:hypothetical protein